ncbi:sentrin-specific protease 2-like [Larus michahellis]|uniref:sentrin-specific protease 2-like n=1 Tax=Larus michahellis TaxID=119627 RepID=UPI003D9B966D
MASRSVTASHWEEDNEEPRSDVEQTLQLGFGELVCHLHASPCHGNGGGKLRDPCPALLVLLGPQSGGDGGVPSELSDKHHRDSLFSCTKYPNFESLRVNGLSKKLKGTNIVQWVQRSGFLSAVDRNRSAAALVRLRTIVPSLRQKRGGQVLHGITWVDVCCPEPSQGDVVTRGSPPAEDTLQQDGPGEAKKSPACEVEEKKPPRLQKRAEGFTPLTEAMEREVVAALGKGEPEEILSSAFKLRVTRQDVHTLRKLCWLNDEVINFYMILVMERSKREGYPSVHAFSSFFYEKLASGGYKAVGRWTRRVDLFNKDIILVPINLRLHWTLAVIDTRKKTVKYYDSLGQGGDKICETLLKYLQEESHEKRNMELNVSEWTVHSMEPHEIPQQSNGSDCGVFICKYADYISREKLMTFTQTHMPYFRKKMVWEILHQELL